MRASAWSGLSSGTLGDLAFLEGPQIDSLVFFYADGTECELWLASPRRLDQLQCGTYRMLIDTPGILAGALFPEHVPTDAEQTDQLRLLLASLGHEMSHF